MPIATGLPGSRVAKIETVESASALPIRCGKLSSAGEAGLVAVKAGAAGGS